MKRLIQHYLEMVIAMFAGMMAWGWLSAMLFGQGGAMGMHASEVIDAEQSVMSQVGGITAIIHPGGSVRDAETLAVADAAGMAVVQTGVRHFRH